MSKKYFIKRNELYAGAVSSYKASKKSSLPYLFPQPKSYEHLRTIFFKLYPNNYGVDLLFPDAYAYPTNGNDDICITNIINLDILLNYLGFKEDLTHRDLLTIVKTFIKFKKKITQELFYVSGISLKEYYNLTEIKNLSLKPNILEPNYNNILNNYKKIKRKIQ